MKNNDCVKIQINKLLNERRYSDALLLLKKSVKEESDRDELCKKYVSLGWLYDQWALSSEKRATGKRQEESEKYFNLALGCKKTKYDAIRGLATVLMHKEEYDSAMVYYKKAHRLKKSFDTYNDLGNIYQKINKRKIAIANYEKAFCLRKGKEEASIPCFNMIVISKKAGDSATEKKYLGILEKLAKKFDLAKMMMERLDKVKY